LKPIQIDQLINAVNKVERIRGNSLVNERVQTLQANLEDFKIKKIVIPLSEGSLFIELKEIIYLKAEGSYVNFLKDGTKILASKNIKDFEEQLTQTEGFFRTHRSFLINTAFITNISSDNTGVTLNGNAEITIARERKQDFIQF
jgi:two-component system LytT family response regulator